jgi:hypothetical protein
MQVKQHSQFTRIFFFFFLPEHFGIFLLLVVKICPFGFHCCKLEQKHCGFSMNFSVLKKLAGNKLFLEGLAVPHFPGFSTPMDILRFLFFSSLLLVCV